MILSNSSEEQILGELIEDIQYVKKQTKKLADRTLREIQKSGAFVREDDARTKYRRSSERQPKEVGLHQGLNLISL